MDPLNLDPDPQPCLLVSLQKFSYTLDLDMQSGRTKDTVFRSNAGKRLKIILGHTVV